MVMKWFNKRRGLANAVLGIFSAFGFALAPRIFSMIIEKLDWQGTWLLLAVIVGLGFVTIVLIFYRDNPNDSGLEADGPMKSGRKEKRPPSLPDHDYSLGEARRTWAFWGFTLGITLTALYISGLIFHIESVFKTAGLSREMALGIFLPTSVIAMIVQFFCGYISDYIRLKYLLMFFMAGMLITSIGLLFLGKSDLAYWSVISGNGIVWGLFTVLIAVTWPRFYGLKNLGAISGFSISLSVFGSALGPYIFSLSFSLTSKYSLVAWLSAGLSIILFLLAFKADNPNE
jgi:cyanate permease